MKKLTRGSLGMIIVCLTISGLTMAQGTPPPPVAPVPPIAKGDVDQNNNDQSEIVIRQKSGKNMKLNIETKGGEVYINGKPLDKYDDKDILIEKRDVDEEGPALSYGPSAFREDYDVRKHEAEDMSREQQAWADAARINAEDINRSQRDLQRQIQKTITLRMNAAFLGVSSRKTDKGGATVLEVTKGSPAEKAGINTGDIITKVNDIKIDNPDVLFETIHNFKPGDKIKVYYTRNGKTLNSLVTLDKSEPMTRTYNYKYVVPPIPPLPEMKQFRFKSWNDQPKLGIKAQDAEDGKGVNILDVEDSSAAAKAGLKKGDIITQFDGNDVNSANDLVEQFQDAHEKSLIKIKIIRSGIPQEIQVKIPRKLKTAEL
jgi:serine protease Do